MGNAKFPLTVHSEGKVVTIIAIGIDLAKNVFAVHGVDEAGKAALVRLARCAAKVGDQATVVRD